jgi:hypothetical protein
VTFTRSADRHVATAVLPYTTACSPSRISLPGADDTEVIPRDIREARVLLQAEDGVAWCARACSLFCCLLSGVDAVDCVQSVTLHTSLGDIKVELACALVPRNCEVSV